MPKRNPYPGLYWRADKGGWFARKYISGNKAKVKDLDVHDKKDMKTAIDRWQAFMAQFPNYKRQKWDDEKLKLTVGEAIIIMITDIEADPKLSPFSVARYKTSLAAIDEYWGKKVLIDLTQKDFKEFVRGRQRTKSRKGGKMSSSSVARDIACLSKMYSVLQSEGYEIMNPVKAWRDKENVDVTTVVRTRTVSPTEEKLLLAACIDLRDECSMEWHRRSWDRLRLAIIIDIETGLRLTELLSAEWKHIRHDTKRIFVPHGSNDKDREVPFSKRAYAALLELDTRHTKWLFPNVRGDGHIHSVENPFNRLRERCHLEDITFHDLRRSCGERLINEYGATMQEVSKWLGHSSVKVTEDHYAHLKVRSLDVVARRVDELYNRVSSMSQEHWDGKVVDGRD